MELGEHIQLNGFEEKQYGELVLVKKLVGNHVKQLSQSLPGYEHLELNFEREDGFVSIEGLLWVDGNERKVHVTDDNVLFAIDRCMKKLLVEN